MRRPHPDAARIISAHGRQAWVQTRLGGLALCHLKGRDLEPLANDWVQVDDPDRPTVVTDLLERRNTLYRQEGQKIKALAANLDLVLIVLAGEPRFAPDAISRLMASLIEQSIDFQIVLNKADLPEALATANELIATFQPVAPCRPWPVVQTSTREPKGLEALARVLQPLARADDQACVALVGQSGMGKSSLLNRLVPDAEAQTNAISTALQSGRHTTTASRVYQAKTEGGLGLQVVDTPGFQRFGISHLQRDDLERIFPEWAQISEELGRCRFVNCSHDHEPDCQIQFKISQLLDSQPAAGQQLESRRQQWLRLLQASS
ncbi:MAG: ribosome small subunit-dependent GTPase RsgA [Pseudomonadota bacterium]